MFDGPESDLMLTENAQPAILAVSTGSYRVAESELSIKLDVNLGHSLGEYSALVASEAIPYSNAIQWVHQRGLAMQKAVPLGEGTMSAIIGAEDDQVIEWCKEASLVASAGRKNSEHAFTVDCIVEPANFNAPGQVVVSGSVDAVDALEKMITEKKIRGVMAKRLQVSAPFHCALMKPARVRMESIFAQALKESHLSPLQVPYIPNRTARITQESGVVFSLLSEQIDHSVMWKQSVETLLPEYKQAFEFGPGKVLQGLTKRILRQAITSLPDASLEVYPIFDLESLKAAEGALK
jgi:[acyl-carrier-protein] S-malonyltransferase